jgi:hypothetical protein
LDEGGRELATPEAMKAYEALRAEDWLRIAVRRFLSGQREASRKALSQVRARRLLGSPKIRRWRSSLLLAAMWALAPLPWAGSLVDLFHRRWRPDEGRAIRDRTGGADAR